MVDKKHLDESNGRLPVMKTYKLFIGGKFPRTESGRYFPINSTDGKLVANLCRASRKDFRNAVVAARKAQIGWNAKTAYNRSQIIYRIAEILEQRKSQFKDEMMLMGYSAAAASKEMNLSIDRLVYYAGWADKYGQIFSSVNSVASSHFNFSLPEPTGIVAGFAPQSYALMGLISLIIPAITGANTCVVLASEKFPLCAITFAEVLNDSDLPPGVVNILTGFRNELIEHFSTHMDVNAIIYCGDDKQQIKTIQKNAASNVKRAIIRKGIKWTKAAGQSPYYILETQEIKTTWHPIEELG